MFFAVFARVNASLKTIIVGEVYKSQNCAQFWLKMNNSRCLLREYLHLGDDHWFRVDSPPSIGESGKNMSKTCFLIKIHFVLEASSPIVGDFSINSCSEKYFFATNSFSSRFLFSMDFQFPQWYSVIQCTIHCYKLCFHLWKRISNSNPQ